MWQAGWEPTRYQAGGLGAVVIHVHTAWLHGCVEQAGQENRQRCWLQGHAGQTGQEHPIAGGGRVARLERPAALLAGTHNSWPQQNRMP